jgi:hypothetical protein
MTHPFARHGGKGRGCFSQASSSDANGNMTNDGSNTLVFDAENRATSATNQTLYKMNRALRILIRRARLLVSTFAFPARGNPPVAIANV